MDKNTGMPNDLVKAIYQSLVDEIRLPEGYYASDSHRCFYGLEDFHIYIKHRCSGRCVCYFVINEECITMSDLQSRPERLELYDPSSFATLELCAYACCLRDKKHVFWDRVKSGCVSLIIVGYIAIIIHTFLNMKR